MDGAIEPPWTGLRRVLQAHTTPPNKQKSQSRLLLRLWLRLLLLPLRVPGRRPGR